MRSRKAAHDDLLLPLKQQLMTFLAAHDKVIINHVSSHGIMLASVRMTTGYRKQEISTGLQVLEEHNMNPTLDIHKLLALLWDNVIAKIHAT